VNDELIVLERLNPEGMLANLYEQIRKLQETSSNLSKKKRIGIREAKILIETKKRISALQEIREILYSLYRRQKQIITFYQGVIS
jgi:hypothetical protein